ncbi:16S rRNA (cytidine(1402)-2'-O)-methyltransferase, partial [bacterium]|nr:16S rRNA (cytidine(1402)-2'-O)-methyltransferase [bacterium]
MKDFDFYIVPTPIGNLGDITSRAIEVLKSVDIIACEDMRVTQKLLNHFDIHTKCISYHKFNEKERINLFLNYLNEGKKMALVSDAGTPLICDPGAVIVDELRKQDIKITSLPGANAVVTFLSQLSRKDEEFTFVGFLPKMETQINDLFEKHKFSDTVFYDSPNRIMKTLELIKQIRPNAKVAIGRELTKMFEEVVVGDVTSVVNHFNENVLKGEIVGMVYRENSQNTNIELDKKIKILKNKNFKAKEISVILSELYDINKNEVY